MANSPRLVITQVDSSSEEEEDMALNPRRGLKDLVVRRNKRSSYKEVRKSQATGKLPPPPPSPPTTFLGLIPLPNLKKKRKEQDLEEGEVVPQKGDKQQKTVEIKGPPLWIVKRTLLGPRCITNSALGL